MNMIAPSDALLTGDGALDGERDTKLREYVERLSRYLTAPLTERLFGDSDVTDIQINPDGCVWLDRHSCGRVHEGDFLPPERVEMFVNAVAMGTGATFDARRAILRGDLPVPVFLRSRFIAFGPPVCSPPALVVRKPPLRIYRLEEYVAQGILAPAQLDAILAAIDGRDNVLVCGATRSGKTTFLNAILSEIADRCPADRVVLIEEALELRCSVRNTLTLRVSPPKYGYAALLDGTLWASPDRIGFGEVRREGASPLLDALSSGHDGCLGTFHASSAEGAARRLNRLASRRGQSQLETIAEAVNVLVLIEGGSVKRRVREVVRVTGFDPRERRFSFHRLA